jgi:uncharacterized membrane protein YfcA
MGYKDAVALVILLSLIVTAVTFFRTRAHYDWRQGWELIVGALAGIPIGIYVLVRADEVLLRHLLGGAMCLFAAKELIFAQRRTRTIPTTFGFPLGVLSGGFDAAFNMGGPPAIAYVYSRPWNREQTVASLQVLFGIGTILRLTLSAGTGLLNGHVLTLGAWALVPLSLCLLAATHVATRFSRDALKKTVFVFLGVMGIKYLTFG